MYFVLANKYVKNVFSIYDYKNVNYFKTDKVIGNIFYKNVWIPTDVFLQ